MKLNSRIFCSHASYKLLIHTIDYLDTNSKTLLISVKTVIQLYADQLLLSSFSSYFSHLTQTYTRNFLTVHVRNRRTVAGTNSDSDEIRSCLATHEITLNMMRRDTSLMVSL